MTPAGPSRFQIEAGRARGILAGRCITRRPWDWPETESVTSLQVRSTPFFYRLEIFLALLFMELPIS